MDHAVPFFASHRQPLRAVLIRQAAVRDLAEITRLRWEACGDRSSGQRYDEYSGYFQAFLADKLADPNWGIIVAEVDGRLAGSVCLQKIFRLPTPSGEPGGHAWLSGLHVDRTFRGQGLRRDLVENAAAWARRSGASLLLVNASEGASSVFRQFGFVTMDGPLQLALTRNA